MQNFVRSIKTELNIAEIERKIALLPKLNDN